ncbi:MAG: DUF3857 domain-containing protein, partial [Saprospiraceae bacterium]|nr:DUF3857 domain-containing protein [Saprospiraceae bacterium]
MKYLLILFCLTIYECLLAEPDQPVATINNYEEEFIISSKSRAIRKLTRTVIVFNEEGDQYAQPYVIYDKFIKVRSFECQLSDLNGNLLKKFKNSDVSDESLTSAGTIYDDNRVKYFSLEKN